MKEYFYLKKDEIDKIDIEDINALAFFTLSLTTRGKTVDTYILNLKKYFEENEVNNYFSNIYNRICNDFKAMRLLKTVINLCLIENNLNNGDINQENINLYHKTISEYNKIITSNQRDCYLLKKSRK